MYDITKIKNDYITGTASYRELCEKYGVSFGYITKVGRSEGWAQARKDFRNKTVMATVRSLSRKNGKKTARKLEELIETADNMMRIFNKAAKRQEDFYSYVDFKGKEHVNKSVNTAALKNFTSALRDLTIVARELHGLTTVVEDRNYKLAKRKLDIEERRNVGPVEDNENATGVILLPEAEINGENESSDEQQ